MPTLELEARGELHHIHQGETDTYRFEQSDPASPIVMMLSMMQSMSDEIAEAISVRKYGSVKIKISMDFADEIYKSAI